MFVPLFHQSMHLKKVASTNQTMKTFCRINEDKIFLACKLKIFVPSVKLFSINIVFIYRFHLVKVK